MKTSPSGSRHMTTSEALSLALERGTIFNRRAIDIHEAKEVMAMMRAKLIINKIDTLRLESGEINQQTLHFNAVSANSYPADGHDDDNTFALWTPSAQLTMTVCNPALFDKFTEGQKFYVDFISAHE